MKYAKIIVKNNYEEKGDLVLRSYVRALKKINADLLLDGDTAFIYGVINQDGQFQEIFTKKIIDYYNYEIVPVHYFFKLLRLTPIELENIKRVIESVIFDKENDFDFEISTMEDLAMDRSVEFDAYNNSLSRINPYFRLGDIDDQKIYNAYNNFTYKIKELTKSQKKNKVLQEFDEYDINNYRQRLNNESNEPEYLVFEIQKRLTKK